MQLFLASDIVYNQRVAPLIKEALDKNGVSGQTIATTKSLPSLEWLSPAVVCDRIGGQGCGGTGSAGDRRRGSRAPRPRPRQRRRRRHDAAARTGRQPRARGVADVPRDVPNQGDSDERNVPVTVTVRGGPKPITVRRNAATRRRRSRTPRSTSRSARRRRPAQAVTVEVVVGKVPGEKNTDNNRQSYTVLFTQ